MKTLFTLVVIVLLTTVGCGTDTTSEMEKASSKSSETSTTSSTIVSSPAQLKSANFFSIEGYVSPLNISVDGKIYRDSEDFYTQELRRLQAEVKEKYAGYKLTFNASVGLRNFKNGMYVFLVATSDVGVASESYVNSTGKFSFMLDGNTDRKVMYTLRATKRISMKLVKDKETIQWCYNMYAEKEIPLDGKSVILRQFGTTVTEYQCSDPANGIQIPDRNYTVEEEEFMARDQAERDRTAKMNEEAADRLAKEKEDLAERITSPTTSSESEN